MLHGVDRDGERRALPWQSYDNSAAEMANWARIHLAGGQLEGRSVLAAVTVAEMRAPQAEATTHVCPRGLR